MINFPKFEKIIIIGAGRLAKACAQEVKLHAIPLECIEPDDTGFPVLQSYCERNNIPFQRLVKKEAIDKFFMGINKECLIVSAYNIHLFSKEVLRKKNLCIINFHNSLLPRHRGRNSPTWSIFEMDPFSGITWHKITTQVDKGQILWQEKIELSEHMKALDLTLQTLESGSQSFNHFFKTILSGQLSPHLIDHSMPETFHLSREIPQQGMLNTSWSIPKMYAFLRSLDYPSYPVFPPAKVELKGKTIEILEYQLNENPIQDKDWIHFEEGGQCLNLKIART